MRKLFVCCLAAVAAAAVHAQGLLRRPGSATARPAAPAVVDTPPAVQPAAPQPPASAPAATGANVAGLLEWKSSDVKGLLDIYQAESGKSVMVDPAVNVAQQVNDFAGLPGLTTEEKLEIVEVFLEMYKVHLEPYGEKLMRAVPREKARKEGIGILMDADEGVEESGRVVSVMIPFKNISIEEAQKALEGFKSDTGSLNVFERINSILVTDTAQNINRILEIVKTIDVSSPVTENVFVRQIKNASAADIQTHLQKIVEESLKEQEKDGKAVQNAANQPQRASNGEPRRLLSRNGREQQQPEAPRIAESIITSISDADRGMIRGKVLILSDERSNKLVIITNKSNMDFFDKVIEQLDVETTPDTVVKVYRLKYAEAEDVSDMINDLIGNASASKNSTKANQNQNARSGQGGNVTTGRSGGAQPQAKAPANQRTGEAKAGELSKENTTVLADKRINGLVVMTNKELVPVVESIIESMDVKLSQVLIETVIIEVTLGDDLQTGIDWVQRGRSPVEKGTGNYRYTDGAGNVITSPDLGESFTRTTTDADGDETETKWTRIGEELTKMVPIRDTFLNRSHYGLGGGGGDSSELLATIVGQGMNIASNANPIGTGINYILKSDRLNLAAVIQASKTDSRTKYIASPIVMTVDNKEATIDATENRQFLTGWQAQSSGVNGSGQPTPNYSSKDIGIKIKITPKINPNGTVMLTLQEEYSQFVRDGQSMLIPVAGQTYRPGTVDLAVERKLEADILLENMQTVVLGGLTETYNSESETGIPILKDIPWIGKWLFGSVTQTENRKELLIFLTPYVLDEGDAAQAEAIRRKKALSDPRPWDDHGWSLSELADPVSKKEQLRRFKDEWAKQDEERKTKLAIEKAKLERAEKLKSMSAEERKMWLELHEKELEDEQQEELREKMLDEESQEELKELADRIRTEKLGEAETALEENDAKMHAENERGKYDRENAQ